MSRVRVPQQASLNLGLGILRNLVNHPTSRGVTQVAKSMGLPASTTHDLLRLLCELGFVVHDSTNRRYRISPLFFDFIGPFACRFGIIPQVDEFIREQAQKLGATIYVSVWWEECTYVACAEGNRGGTVALGSHTPPYVSSCGKVLISQMNPSLWRRYAPGPGSLRLTPWTNTDPAVFLTELKVAHAEGVAFNEQEGLVDVCSVAAPIKVPNSVSDYAIALVTSLKEWKARPRQEWADEIRALSGRLGEELGGARMR